MTKSTGLDLYAAEGCAIAPGAQGQVKIRLTLALPTSTYGRIAPQSGLAWKHWIFINAGVIDVDYQKELIIILWNNSPDSFHIQPGDRIAQLILEKIKSGNPTWTSSLPPPTANHKGFRSTSIKVHTPDPTLLDLTLSLADQLKLATVPEALDLLVE
jgi:dUTP pyrophosphatase